MKYEIFDWKKWTQPITMFVFLSGASACVFPVVAGLNLKLSCLLPVAAGLSTSYMMVLPAYETQRSTTSMPRCSGPGRWMDLLSLFYFSSFSTFLKRRGDSGADGPSPWRHKHHQDKDGFVVSFQIYFGVFWMADLPTSPLSLVTFNLLHQRTKYNELKMSKGV